MHVHIPVKRSHPYYARTYSCKTTIKSENPSERYVSVQKSVTDRWKEGQNKD